jgi:hypothetical protein
MSITDVFNSPVNQWAKTPTLALLQIFKGLSQPIFKGLSQPNGESTDYGHDGMNGEDEDEVFHDSHHSSGYRDAPSTRLGDALHHGRMASKGASPELRQVFKMPLAVNLMLFSG